MPNPKVRTLTIGGVTYDLQDNISGYITGITSSDVTNALGFTPYNATNPNGYTNNTGTITSVKTTAGAHTTINVSSGAANFNVPTKTSHLTNDSGFLTSYTETDPTVPSWAKESSKPSYNFSEIGSTPTTLSGYGITNAYTKTEVDGLVSGVLHYKGTKANSAALPSSGNTTGDVWHVTDTGAEYAWDGSTWQELGTAVDLSGYLQTSDIASWAKQSTKPSYALSELTGASDVQAIEALSGTSGLLKKTAADTWTLDTSTYLTSYTETDPVFTASAAYGISSSDISNWNAKPSTDTNTTYTLSNALSSHKFTSTLTAGGSGSGTSTATMEFVAGTGITLTDDTTNKKITIGCSVENTDEKLATSSGAANTTYSIILGTDTNSATTKYRDRSGLVYQFSEGTTSVIGVSTLKLGNFTSSGTYGNRRGVLEIYGTTTYSHTIQGDATAGRTITLPDKTGTVALTSDIPDVSGFITTPGLEKTFIDGNYEGGANWVPGDENNEATLQLGIGETNTYAVLTLGSAGSVILDSFGGNNSISFEMSSLNFYYYINHSAQVSFPLPSSGTHTIALTSDIPSVYSSTNTGGYLTMATLPIYDGTVV